MGFRELGLGVGVSGSVLRVSGRGSRVGEGESIAWLRWSHFSVSAELSPPFGTSSRTSVSRKP